MRIWKYELKITDTQRVLVPLGAKFLTTQFQHGVLCLWAMVDETIEKTEDRLIRIIGTGNPIPDGHHRKYIATAQHHNGDLVWHVFEED